ncbi:MAG TPA: hypothetical protein VGK55_00325 [Actinomycetes bacterium]
MAKALLGHVGGPDPRVLSEMRRLQQRVRELEHELDRVQAENDALNEAVHGDLAMDVTDREPALA